MMITIKLLLAFSCYVAVSLESNVLKSLIVRGYNVLFTDNIELPKSPCPNIFTYEYDGLDWYGKIETVIPKNSDEINLLVKMSYESLVRTAHKGSVELVDHKYLLDNVLSGKPITFKINFPSLIELPKITQILLNEKLICVDDKELKVNNAETVFLDDTIKILEDDSLEDDLQKPEYVYIHDPKTTITRTPPTPSPPPPPSMPPPPLATSPKQVPSQSNDKNNKETTEAGDTFIPDDSVNLLGISRAVNPSIREQQRTRPLEMLGMPLTESTMDKMKEDATPFYILPRFLREFDVNYDIGNRALRRQKRQNRDLENTFRQQSREADDALRQFDDFVSRSSLLSSFNIDLEKPFASQISSDISRFNHTEEESISAIPGGYKKTITYTSQHKITNPNGSGASFLDGGNWNNFNNVNFGENDEEHTTFNDNYEEELSTFKEPTWLHPNSFGSSNFGSNGPQAVPRPLPNSFGSSNFGSSGPRGLPRPLPNNFETSNFDSRRPQAPPRTLPNSFGSSNFGSSGPQAPSRTLPNSFGSSNFGSSSPRARPRLVPERLNMECGTTQATPLFKHGKGTYKGDWPWLVAMFVKKGRSDLEFHCGGTLVSGRHIVTAAHCVRNKINKPLNEDEIFAIPGAFNVQAWSQDPDAQLHNVMKIVSHPKYSGNYKYLDDIAVLILENRVQFSNFIIPACLWKFDTDQQLLIGKNGTVVGWGRNENGLTTTPEPREGEVPIVSTNTCKDSHNKFHDLTSDTTICAGARNGVGPCNGDSGGGMYIPMNKRWYLRGIVSVSLPSLDKSCDLDHFVVYTDATKYLDFLDDIMNDYP